MAKVNSIKKITDNRFLNLFEANLTNEETNKEFNYFFSSRRKEEDLAIKKQNHDKADAVMIVPIDQDGGIYLIKQYRPIINDYILEFPAGLVDENEPLIDAAMRELKEETGLYVSNIFSVIPPSYTSVGMTDETCTVYYATVIGEPSLDFKEENEDIEILYFTKDQIEELLVGTHGLIAIKTLMLLQVLRLSNELSDALN